jgi:hypothetical protein
MGAALGNRPALDGIAEPGHQGRGHRRADPLRRPPLRLRPDLDLRADRPEQHRVTRAPGKAIGGGEDLSRTPAKYRALLRLTDREIGRLFDELAGREILDIELANRKLFRTEYPAIHASLIVCPCAAAAVAVRLAGDGEGLSGRGGSAASESA